ncbi:hypothetical protein BDV25DRAFT_5682 [Aspergillus avenaceus]|uniref:Uncharacterized protein n=1 Tax=Aspergillus avenaceus TaxID=36643 RepID=A0A5N6U5Y7_ASPAV|nr:hypothetical protein BDV25DRAFT_5682 [Aspergillus avenaceus]
MSQYSYDSEAGQSGQDFQDPTPEKEDLPDNSSSNIARDDAMIIVTPYAIEEPDDDDARPAAPELVFASTPEHNAEEWQTELADEMEDLRCDSDNNINRQFPKFKRGKKRKPASSTATGNSWYSQQQKFTMPSDRQYGEGPNFKSRRLRRESEGRHTTTPSESPSDTASYGIDSSEGLSPSTDDTSIDIPNANSDPEPMDLD